MIRALRNKEQNGTSSTKSIYKIPIASIFKEEKPDDFPLRLGKKPSSMSSLTTPIPIGNNIILTINKINRVESFAFLCEFNEQLKFEMEKITLKLNIWL